MSPYDAWKTTPPEGEPWDLEAVADAADHVEKARRRLEKADLLTDEMRDRLLAVEKDLENLVEELE